MIKGSCLCGGIEFVVRGEPKQINLCHCHMCQKFSGSAFGSFMRVPTENYEMVKGRDLEKIYNSSDFAARSFCEKCGTSLRYIHKEVSEYVFLAAGCLDQDPKIKPRHHIFVKDKADWFMIEGDLPQFEDWRTSISNNAK